MDATRASHECLADALRLFALWQEHGRVLETQDALLVVGTSRFPVPYSNAVLPLGLPGAPEAVLATAADAFPDRHHLLWIRADGDERLERLALDRGYRALGEVPSLVIARRAEPRPVVPGLEIARVEDAPGLEAFIDVSVDAFSESGLPLPVARTLFARLDAILASTAELLLGRVDGEPAAAALSITGSGGIGGVHWVGTRDRARRRGAADALTRLVTNAAFDRGARLVALQASSAGEPIYRRMGYREAARYRRLLSPPREAS